jgi:outer membrane protein OmpA-like peptidoglycan-associated protein
MIRDQYYRVVLTGKTAKQQQDEADKEANVLVLKDVLFDFDKYTIRPDAGAELGKALEFLQKRPELSFEVSGHTDHLGTNEYNQWLSEMRAKAVKEWLVSRGVAERRLIPKGYGESLPVAMPQKNKDGSDNAGNRQKNRRVELRELKKAYDDGLQESVGAKADDTFIDITNEVTGSPRWEDEDGLIQSFSFTLKDSSMWSDVITIGLGVDFWGGDLVTSKLLFQGSIRKINPRFGDDGVVELDIDCYGKEWAGLAQTPRDLFYPQVNHPRQWGKGSSITLDKIVENLCKDAGFEKGRVQVKHNITYTLEKPIRQSRMTDWVFIQRLAKTAYCTFWTEVRDGKRYYNLVEVAQQKVDVMPDVSFYYPLREVGKFTIIETDASQIQMRNVDVTLDPDTIDGMTRPKKQTDLNTGEDTISQEVYDEETRQWEIWVLDMAKVRALSDEAQDKILAAWEMGNLNWDGEDGKVGVKAYFRRVGSDPRPWPSRTPQSDAEEYFNQLSESGLDWTGSKTQLQVQEQKAGATEGKPSTSTYELDWAELRKASPETYADILRRRLNGSVYTDPKWESDFKKYFKELPKGAEPPKGEDPAAVKDPAAAVPKGKGKAPKLDKATKRDAGFKIVCTVDGNFRITTKQSYILQGLGNYTGVYYLYRLSCSWGNNGFEMQLTFVK